MRQGSSNALAWDSGLKRAIPLSKVLNENMGWERDYSFRIPCQTVREFDGARILSFDLDHFIGQTRANKHDTIVSTQRVETEVEPDEPEDARSYYYPPDEEEPQEIRDMEEKINQANEVNRRLFGTPAFLHDPGARSPSTAAALTESDMVTQAKPLGTTHKVDHEAVDNLLQEIMNDPPTLPLPHAAYPNGIVSADSHNEEG